MAEIKIPKRGSRFNAVTHGIFSGILLKQEFLDESESAYSGLVSVLRRAIRPADGFELLLVEKLAISLLRLTRVYEADWKVAPKLFEMVEDVFEGDYPKAVTRWVVQVNRPHLVNHGPAPDLLMRYESSIERQIGRTLGQLGQWRRMRQVDSGSPESKDNHAA
jgi:hypothetical protein